MNEQSRNAFKLRLARRYAAEKRFRFYGVLSITLALVFLATLFISVFANGYSTFQQTKIRLDVDLSNPAFAQTAAVNDRASAGADFSLAIKQSLYRLFPEATSRADRKKVLRLASSFASFELQEMLAKNPDLAGRVVSLWLSADDEVDQLLKGHIDRMVPESERRLDNQTLSRIDRLLAEGRLDKRFNISFFTHGDSREPEQAGILGALVGSLYALSITFLLSFPIGIAAAIYLEEFAPKNRFTDLIEININNLAAVPSVIFGLLGLSIFINFFGLPRSTPLVGGIVLSLMTLPTVIIASRASIKSVPPSIREAALGLGASHMQTVLQHVLPLAMPGMLTGSIIGMAQALGESAPLLMIGMVAFIADVPTAATDPSAALPVLIYQWAKSPERAFVERTAAAIIVLLVFLVLINITAILLRKRFERRW